MKIYPIDLGKVLLLLGVASLSLPASAADAPVVTVKRLGDIVVPVEHDAPAVLISLNDTPLSAQLSALVTGIQVDVGQEVKKGAVLATLDCRDFQAGLRQAAVAVETARAQIAAGAAKINATSSRIEAAQARMAAARSRLPATQSQLRLAQVQLQRNQKLRKDKLIPTEMLDQAQTAFDSARSALHTAQSELEAAQADIAAINADVGTAKAELGVARTGLDAAQARQDEAEITVGRCQILAPFAGQITERQLQLGQVATPGSPAFHILQTGALELTASLSASEVRDLGQGSAIRFVVDDQQIAVEPRAVVGQIAGNTRTQEVRFRLRENRQLPVGTTGRIIWQGQHPALPASWLTRREGTLGLMLVVDDKANFLPLGNAQEGQPFLTDLPADTLLIDQNRAAVSDGQPVRLADGPLSPGNPP